MLTTLLMVGELACTANLTTTMMLVTMIDASLRRRPPRAGDSSWRAQLIAVAVQEEKMVESDAIAVSIRFAVVEVPPDHERLYIYMLPAMRRIVDDMSKVVASVPRIPSAAVHQHIHVAPFVAPSICPTFAPQLICE